MYLSAIHNDESLCHEQNQRLSILVPHRSFNFNLSRRASRTARLGGNLRLHDRAKPHSHRVSPLAAGLEPPGVVTEMAQDPE